jgi:hypothetical protein
MRLRRENGAGFALLLTSRLSAINQADRILDTCGVSPSQSKSWRAKKEAVAHHNGLEKSLPPLTSSGARHVE